MTRAALAVLACTGCSQIFGLDDPTRGRGSSDASVDGNRLDDVGTDSPAARERVRRITVSGQQIINGPFADFPVLVDITAPWLRSTALGGDITSTDGYDIYFSSDVAGDQRLDHEVDEYGVDGVLAAWVRIPVLTSTTSFYMHYGDPTITDSQESSRSVWSSSYVNVMHLDSNSEDATEISTAFVTQATTTAAGRFGGAIGFNGADSYINVGSIDGIDNAFDGGGTIEAWIRPTGFGESSWGRVADKGGDSGWILYVNDNNNNDSFSFAYGSNSTSFGQWTSPANSIVLNTWQHIAAVFDRNDSGNTPLLYINGVAVGVTQQSQPSGAFDTDAPHNMYVGNTGTGDRAYAGQIDEVRLSNVIRSAGWFATQHANQANPSTFFDVSNEL